MGTNFARGKQYKNVSENRLIQAQESMGNDFLVIDELQPIQWEMGSEVKQIGGYTSVLKLFAIVPEQELSWYNFSWNQLSTNASSTQEPEIKLTQIEAGTPCKYQLNKGLLNFGGYLV